MGEIKKQSISNTAISYTGALLGFLIIYVQPHFISASDIGLLRLLYSFAWLAAIVMPFGTGSAIMRYFPRIRDDASSHQGVFAVILILATTGALVSSILLYANRPAISEYFNRSAEFPAYFDEAVLLAIILSLVSLYTTLASSLFKTTFTVFLTDIFTRVGQLLVVFLYYQEVLGKPAFIRCYVAIFLVQLLLLVVFLVRSRAVSFRINFTFFKSFRLREVFFYGLLMMVTAFASLGIKFIDQLMVGHFLSGELVGIYATSVMMCVVMEIPFNSLDRIASPKIAHAWNLNDTNEVEKIYEMSSRYMFFLGGMLFCLLWAGVDLIFLFLPPEYQQGKTAFYLVSLASMLNLLTGVNSSVILFSERYYAISVFLIVLLLVAVAANNYLIPLYGINGAATATLIAIGVFNIIKYLYIRWKFGMQPLTRSSLYISVCVILSISLILLLPDTFHPALKCAVGALFTVLLFSVVNIRYGIIPEVNKLFRRLKLIS